ncbi:MAG TPA: ribosome silencing factor [Bryobacteraceae bacterium]|jgi:ribosome-associated protein|nr:ribosome silencing factor [Bryobacteraceae bacterium]
MWLEAVRAAEEKQARNIRVLDLREVTSFADYFVIASGANSRQIQAIADEIHQRLKKLGEMPNSMEGYDNADWILMDYGDYLIHIFSEKARLYYDLERLWRDAKTVEFTQATT